MEKLNIQRIPLETKSERKLAVVALVVPILGALIIFILPEFRTIENLILNHLPSFTNFLPSIRVVLENIPSLLLILPAVGIILGVKSLGQLWLKKSKDRIGWILATAAIIIYIVFYILYFAPPPHDDYSPCYLNDRFLCRDYQLTESNFSIMIINNYRATIDVTALSLMKQGMPDSPLECIGNTFVTRIIDGQEFILTCENIPKSWGLIKGNKAKLGMEIIYATERGKPSKVTGTVVATIT